MTGGFTIACLIYYISKITRAFTEIAMMTFTDVDIRHRMAPMRMYYSSDLDVNFPKEKIKGYYLESSESQRKKCEMMTFINVDIPQLNGAIANFVFRRLGTNFQGKKIILLSV